MPPIGDLNRDPIFKRYRKKRPPENRLSTGKFNRIERFSGGKLENTEKERYFSTKIIPSAVKVLFIESSQVNPVWENRFAAERRMEFILGACKSINIGFF